MTLLFGVESNYYSMSSLATMSLYHLSLHSKHSNTEIVNCGQSTHTEGKKKDVNVVCTHQKQKKNQRKQKQIIVQSFRLLCWLIWYELRLLKTTVCKLCVSAFTYWQCDTTLRFFKNSHCVHEKCIHFSGLRFLSRGIGSVFACKYCVKGKVTVKRVRLWG